MPYIVGFIERVTIREISETTVNFQYARDLHNGTEETGSSWVDLSTRAGT